MFFLSPDLRASDAEREAAVEFLKRHYAEGRLSDRELGRRIDAAYRAEWDSQLERLTADLPAVLEPVPAGGPALRGAPIARAALAAVAVVALLAIVPADVWAPLFAMLVPLLVMLVFAVGPFALPILAFAWLARALSGPRDHRRGQLPRGHVGGGFIQWEPLDRRRRF